jgi:hypothetical protein
LLDGLRERLGFCPGLVRQLAAMDDHMLKDIGLRRGEIEYCVRYGRDG